MGNPKIKLIFLQIVYMSMVFACTVPPLETTSTMEPTLPITNMVSIIPTATVSLSTNTAIIITATVTATLIPTIAYTPTSSIPMVMVSVGTNCRAGPGRVYDLVDGLMVGEQVEIVKLAPAGVDYVVVKRPHGSGECWLWLQHATVIGDTSQLPIAAIPPMPTPIVTPTITATPTSSSPSPTPTATSTITATLTSPSPFAGAWTMVFVGNSYNVVITQTGNNVSGSFTMVSDNIVTFNGALSSDSSTVTGTFIESAGPGGSFVWYVFTNLAQFNGHFASSGSKFEWCGYKDGQSVPAPCLVE